MPPLRPSASQRSRLASSSGEVDAGDADLVEPELAREDFDPFADPCEIDGVEWRGHEGRAATERASIIRRMDALPVEVYSAASVRAMDRRAIEAEGIPGYTLMQRAGEAACAAVRRHWPAARAIAVLCGPGNNGGDGYVVARLAQAAGLDVRTLAVSDPGSLRGDAAIAWRDFTAAGGRTEAFRAGAFERADLVVDALLGTGFRRPLAGEFRAAIELLNRAARPVLALDVPSGLDADSGLADGGLAVRATRTLAFVALKSGYYLGEAADHVGALEFAGLGLPPDVRANETAVLRRIDAGIAGRALPPRLRSAHKGDHGRVVIVGGHAMPGAARLAGEAALRTGAGLVTVATSAQSTATVLAGRPELIVRAAATPQELDDAVRRRRDCDRPGARDPAGYGTRHRPAP